LLAVEVEATNFLAVKFSMGLTPSINSRIFSFASASRSILLIIANKRPSLGSTPHFIRNLLRLI
jgi:hypothetical protein